jgi:hypothetical protein
MRSGLVRLMLIQAVVGLCLAFLTVLSGEVAHAQPGLTEEPLTIAGVSHVLVYPASETAARMTAMRRTMDVVIDRYVRLTGVTAPKIALVFTGGPPYRPGVLAAAGPKDKPEDPYDCYVRVFDMPENSVISALRFTVAHEIAHCFQFALNSASIDLVKRIKQDGFIDPNLWWIEGSAEWMASRVYAPVGNPISRTLRDFYIITNQSPIISDYENYWFFAFMGRFLGERAVVQFLTTVSIDPNQHNAAINRISPSPDLLAGFARLTVRRQMRYQPPLPLGDLFDVNIAALPVRQLLVARPLSVQLVQFNLPPIAPGQAYHFRLTNGYAEGVRLTLPNGVTVGENGVQICGDSAPRPFVVAVSFGTSTSETFDAQVEISERDCAPKLCYAGEWLVGGQMSTSDRHPSLYFQIEQASYDEALLVISEDGNVIGHMVGTIQQPGGFVNINAPSPVSGAFHVVGEPVESGGWLYYRIAFSAPIQGNATGSGGTVDANNIWTFYDGGRTGLIRFPAYGVLTCGNPRYVDGVFTGIYDYLGFIEGGDVGAATDYMVWPTLELFRAGSPDSPGTP